MSIFVLAFGSSTSYEAAAGHRLYFLKRVFEETASFKTKPMHGFAVTESYLNTFETIVLKSEDFIPREDEVFFWPGDAPFYYATQRRCPLKNFQVLAATGLNTSKAMDQLDKKKVPWIIIRTSDDQSPFPLHLRNLIIRAWFLKNYSIVYSQDEFVIGKRKK